MGLWFERALLPDGWTSAVRIEVAGAAIAEVTAGTAAAPEDERFAIGLPGLANVHSHAFQRGMAGLSERPGPEDDDFWTWRQEMYRFLDRLTPDDMEAIAALAYAEMLESGFTRVGEFHYLHHAPDGGAYDNPAEMAARIAAAAAAAGIGLTLLPVFYAHGGFGGQPPVPGQRRFLSTPDSFAHLMAESRRAVAGLPGTVVGVAPHSLRAVTPDELDAVLPLAAGGPVHIHAAEQVREVEACLAWSGRRPVEWLLDRGAGAGWCLIHATHTTPEETVRLARSGAVAGYCPVTEANLGDGLSDSRALLADGGALAVGTDSNVRIDAAEELRLLEDAQRLRLRRRNVLSTGQSLSTGRVVFDAARRGGAAALGVSAAGLAAGAPADLLALDGGSVVFAGRDGDALLDSWIFAARTPQVEAVWVAGRQVVSAGRHRDREAIAGRFRRVLARLAA